MKLRTFITDDEHRDEMVANVYDTTYEVIRKGIDTLVVLDDSIVRGTNAGEEHPQNAGSAASEKDCGRFVGTPDPLPGLLWYRHEPDG